MNKKYNLKHIGEKHKTNENLGSYDILVIDGGSKKGYCIIQIENWIKEVKFCHVKSGTIKYPYHNSICNIGYLGEGEYKYSSNKKIYTVWTSMMKRCYSKKYQDRFSTYVGCTVCKEWLNFQNFAKWFDKSNYKEGYELDKDLLIEGNKIYSPRTCIFIPQCLNTFLIRGRSSNTSGYTGITQRKDNFKWRVTITDIDTHLRSNIGTFELLQDAIINYNKAKIDMCKRMKIKMKTEYNITDERIINNIK